MGVDLLLVIELKIIDEWVGFSNGHIQLARDYDLYGIMAGVRDYNNLQIFAPKGFPDDLSDESRDNLQENISSFVTPSWLSYQELQKVNSQLSHSHTDLDACLAVMKVYHDNGMDTRIVFAFDN